MAPAICCTISDYRPSFGSSVQRLFRRFPDEIYIIGIEFITLITVVGLIMALVRSQSGLGLIIGAILLVLPATQAAVELMNYLVTAVLTPRPLPKFDFSRAVDAAFRDYGGHPNAALE